MKTPLCTEQHHHLTPHLSGDARSLSPEEIAVHSLSAPTTVERRRWQVIALLAEQTPIAEIVAATGYRPRTIRQIAQRYRELGPAGLVDARQHSTGATPLLSDMQQRELRQALLGLPSDGGAWTGPKVAAWMAARTGRRVQRQRGWEYLRRLGSGGRAAPKALEDGLFGIWLRLVVAVALIGCGLALLATFPLALLQRTEVIPIHLLYLGPWLEQQSNGLYYLGAGLGSAIGAFLLYLAFGPARDWLLRRPAV